MKSFLLSIGIALAPWAALAQSVSWQDYVVPETGAVAQIPTSIFSKDGGKPEEGYGKRFISSDGRAKLTVQSVPNTAGDSPAVFLAKKNPPMVVAATDDNIKIQRYPPAIAENE